MKKILLFLLTLLVFAGAQADNKKKVIRIGTELLGKEEAAKYNNYTMSGNYLRPFTFELSASIKF